MALWGADALHLRGRSVSLSTSTAHARLRKVLQTVLHVTIQKVQSPSGRREGGLELPISSSGCPIDQAPFVTKTVPSADVTVPPLP